MKRVNIKQLVWDDWNIKHIWRHKVKVNEVEEICKSAKEALESYKERVIVLGRTKKKRLLTAVLAPEEKGKFYVVTARDMSKKERRIFLK